MSYSSIQSSDKAGTLSLNSLADFESSLATNSSTFVVFSNVNSQLHPQRTMHA